MKKKLHILQNNYVPSSSGIVSTLCMCFSFPECFDFLKKQLPSQADEKKTSNLSILHSALRFIQTLKRKERELEHELERLAREKIAAQQRLATLKKEMTAQCDGIDFGLLLPEYGDLKVEALPIATKKSVLEKEIKIDMVSTTAPTVVTTVLDRLPIVSSPVVKVTTQTNGFKEVCNYNLFCCRSLCLAFRSIIGMLFFLLEHRDYDADTTVAAAGTDDGAVCASNGGLPGQPRPGVAQGGAGAQGYNRPIAAGGRL